MGQPKAWLDWHGSTLLYRAAAVLARTVDGPVVVVAAPGQELPPLPSGVTVAEDPVEGLGPMQGLAVGLAAVAGQAETAFVCSTDLPFLHPAFVRRVLRALTPARTSRCRSPGASGSRWPPATGPRWPGWSRACWPRVTCGRACCSSTARWPGSATRSCWRTRSSPGSTRSWSPWSTSTPPRTTRRPGTGSRRRSWWSGSARSPGTAATGRTPSGPPRWEPRRPRSG
ncbi:molybdenum cofactor guanylyltransferase [Nonomuraea thailandensis]